jgi:hypothetical protein
MAQTSKLDGRPKFKLIVLQGWMLLTPDCSVGHPCPRPVLRATASVSVLDDLSQHKARGPEESNPQAVQ